MPISLGFWEMGCAKLRGCPHIAGAYHKTRGCPHISVTPLFATLEREGDWTELTFAKTSGREEEKMANS